MKKLKGVPASPGFAAGKAFLYIIDEAPEIPGYKIKNEDVEPELKRLDAAFGAAEKELVAIHEKALSETGGQAAIFSAHISMLQDPVVRDEIIEKIAGTLDNAELVVHETFRNLAQMMSNSPDPVFRERAADINDVSGRVLGHLSRIQKKPLSGLDRDVIIVARDLLPSELLEMNRAHVKGLVTGQGSGTSHIAILARSFEIPAVLGLSGALDEIQNNNELIIDGDKGEVLLNPGKDEIEKYKSISISKRSDEQDLLADYPAETTDGYKAKLKANIEIPDEAAAALRYGASGIGLYRSEFLFLGSGKSAGEEIQFEAYSRVLQTMGDLPVTIRTADIGADKALPESGINGEKNPLLGWRAVRFSMARPDFFKTQLRALLRAGVKGNLKIMFPLISGVDELDGALGLLDEAKAECKKSGCSFNSAIDAGIMIEVPSAAVIADLLAAKSAFFSIGTNDLLQYTLAADRENEKVNYLAKPHHPAIIRLLKTVIDGARERGIKTSVCGEIAGDSAFTALLLGLGLNEFSMVSSSIPKIKKIIRGISISGCRSLASEVMRGTTAAGNAALIDNWMKENYNGH